MRHLVRLARDAGLRQLTAEVLPDNAPMLNVFRKFGFRPVSGSDPRLVHLALVLR
jgi:RimJ/RimL family protein N-acetyltransferase